MRKRRTTQLRAAVTVTPEERYHLINDVAYFREIRRGRRGDKAADPAGSWRDAEAEIDSVLLRPRAP